MQSPQSAEMKKEWSQGRMRRRKLRAEQVDAGQRPEFVQRQRKVRQSKRGRPG